MLLWASSPASGNAASPGADGARTADAAYASITRAAGEHTNLSQFARGEFRTPPGAVSSSALATTLAAAHHAAATVDSRLHPSSRRAAAETKTPSGSILSTPAAELRRAASPAPAAAAAASPATAPRESVVTQTTTSRRLKEKGSKARHFINHEETPNFVGVHHVVAHPMSNAGDVAWSSRLRQSPPKRQGASRSKAPPTLQLSASSSAKVVDSTKRTSSMHFRTVGKAKASKSRPKKAGSQGLVVSSGGRSKAAAEIDRLSSKLDAFGSRTVSLVLLVLDTVQYSGATGTVLLLLCLQEGTA